MKEKNKKNFFLKIYKKNPIKNKKKSFIKLEKKYKKNLSEKPDKRSISIFLYLIGLDNSVNIIKNFKENEIKVLMIEFLKIDNITENDIKNINDKIGNIDNISTNLKISDKKEYISNLLIKAYGLNKGSRLYNEILNDYSDLNKLNKYSFSFLDDFNENQIFEIISDESDSIIAVVLSMINPKKVAMVLKLFPPNKAIEIIRKMSKKIEIKPEVIDAIINNIKKKSEKFNDKYIKIEGKNKLVQILKNFSFSDLNSIIDNLKDVDSGLADEIEEKIFTFNDILKIPKKSLIYALKKYSDPDIAYILKGSNDDIKNYFFKCISKKRKSIIEEEMVFLGKVKLSEVEKKRKEFTNHLKQLESIGKITLLSDKEVYVE
ncbi:MAG: hypothetical protein JXB50_06390 [Spirochaetes bacterium]|nr:hypothetical protein [Spirochaetota bacterium]